MGAAIFFCFPETERTPWIGLDSRQNGTDPEIGQVAHAVDRDAPLCYYYRDSSRLETVGANFFTVSEERNSLNQARVIPVFPLPNVVLFPKIHLPLHIFEPRYRQMVKDAIANHKQIGMALLRGNWEKSYHANPSIYSVGCVGEIVSVTPFPDGRYNIVLYGFREYDLMEDIFDLTPYRQAKVLFRDELRGSEQTLPNALKKEILELVQQTLGEDQSELLNILKDFSLDGETWLNLCCFSLDASSLEKQSLLEAKSLEERVACLLNVLYFKVVERGTPFEGLKESKDRKLPN